MAEYNPFAEFNPIFASFEASKPQPIKIQNTLFGDYTLPERYSSYNGNIIAPANTPETEKEFNMDYLNEMQNRHSETSIPSDNYNFEGGSLIDNERFAYEYLVKNKIPKGTAAGIVGNLYHEGLANPTKSNKDSHNTISYGIAQFNSNGEYPALMKWAESKGIKGNPNFQQQLDFIIDIINNRPNLSILKNENITPTEASFVWGSKFERFAGDNKKDGYKNRKDSNHIKRAARANKIFKAYG